MTTLTKHDRESEVWRVLMAHMEARLDALRRANDAPQDAETTALIRGEIRGLKALIALNTDRPDLSQ